MKYILTVAAIIPTTIGFIYAFCKRCIYDGETIEQELWEKYKR